MEDSLTILKKIGRINGKEITFTKSDLRKLRRCFIKSAFMHARAKDEYWEWYFAIKISLISDILNLFNSEKE